MTSVQAINMKVMKHYLAQKKIKDIMHYEIRFPAKGSDQSLWFYNKQAVITDPDIKISPLQSRKWKKAIKNYIIFN